MRGNVGPYVQIDGPGVWVPRTVPYLGARRVAADAAQGGERLRYLELGVPTDDYPAPVTRAVQVLRHALERRRHPDDPTDGGR